MHIDFTPSFISVQVQLLIGGVLMIWSRHCGYGIHCDIVNPRRLELEAAKEILAEVYGIQITEVEGLISRTLWIFG